LAYVVATDLEHGLLVYAAGDRDRTIHEMLHIPKSLEVYALDIAGTPADILLQVELLADRIRDIRRNELSRVTA
jgi:hypothetical protein